MKACLEQTKQDQGRLNTAKELARDMRQTSYKLRTTLSKDLTCNTE